MEAVFRFLTTRHGTSTERDRKILNLLHKAAVGINLLYGSVAFPYDFRFALPNITFLFLTMVSMILVRKNKIDLVKMFLMPVIIFQMLSFAVIFGRDANIDLYFMLCVSFAFYLNYKSFYVIVNTLACIACALAARYVFIDPYYSGAETFTKYFGYSNIFFAIAILFILSYAVNRDIKEYQTDIEQQNEMLQLKEKEIREDKERIQGLLLNILPEEVAVELKIKGSVTPVYIPQATILFADFVGFTKVSQNLTPEEIVSELDYCFTAFDEIMDKFSLEKLKTIGDAYMCAGGLPAPSTDHAVSCVRAAKEMIEFMKSLSSEHPFHELRVGIHTGPVVAGVIGKKKFLYDIWGDTVNLASRMETGSEPGRINISESVFEQIKDEFNCEFRGNLPVKGKGKIGMYFVA